MDWDRDLPTLLAPVVKSLHQGETAAPLAAALLQHLDSCPAPGTGAGTQCTWWQSDEGAAQGTLPADCDRAALACRWLLDGRIDAGIFLAILEILAATAPRTEVERYRLGALLGEGGMGQVFAVQDLYLRREVAAKFLKDRYSPGRFLEEARLTAGLDHPNIVPVHDAGVDAQGNQFYIMKRVQGHSLKDVLAEGELPTLVDRLDIFIKVCDALAFAHERGVVHCDLKPANVMVERHGEVRVMDWGIAHSSPGSASFGGTPDYMAPEQILGEPVDTRTDIYALGELLYEILARRPAFRGSRSQMRARKLAGRFDPHSRSFSLPWALQVVIQRAMAREPADRYANVGELQAAVRAFRNGDLVPGVEYPVWARAGHWAGRHQRTLGTALAFLLGLLVGGALYLVDIQQRNDDLAMSRRETELRLAGAQIGGSEINQAWETLRQGAVKKDLLGEGARLGLATIAGVRPEAVLPELQIKRRGAPLRD